MSSNISWNALIAGVPNREAVDFVNQQFRPENISRMNAILGQRGKELLSQSVQYAQTMQSSKIMNIAQRALNMVGGYARGDVIAPLLSMDDLQQAKPRMIQMIMSDQELRDRRRKGRIEGWGDLYEDPDPDREGIDHLDHALVHQGMWNRTEHYSEQYHYHDSRQELSFQEQVAVIDSIAATKALLSLHPMRDPTSPTDAKRG